MPWGSKIYRIGTRKSLLAQTQANWVLSQLKNKGMSAELHFIESRGDTHTTKPLYAFAGEATGLFTKELERALVDGEVDIAVHSLKDLPTTSDESLRVVCTPKREDARDFLIADKRCVDMHQPWMMAAGTLLGTSSLRRQAIARLDAPQVKTESLRGNVPTRLEKIRGQQVGAILLAGAGVARLGLDLSEFFVKELSLSESVPAPAQGALGIQIRKDADSLLVETLESLSHLQTRMAVDAERAVLKALMGGCSLPLGIHVMKIKNEWEMHGFLAQFSGATHDTTVLHKKFLKRSDDLNELIIQCVREFKAF